MQLTFFKYQGTGNDFVMIDNRELIIKQISEKTVKSMCDRRFGIGADGLILIEQDSDSDFKMVYFNSDGKESTMCGNGGRCAIAFAHFLGIIHKQTTFKAIDGLHNGKYINQSLIRLEMNVDGYLKKEKTYFYLNTGSPHHVVFSNDIEKIDVKKEGATIRYSELYGITGSNVNFVQQLTKNKIFVRTYERGVEDETLSCGTGVTASALIFGVVNNVKHIEVKTLGGDLQVDFDIENNVFDNVILSGPVAQVFKGFINIE